MGRIAEACDRCLVTRRCHDILGQVIGPDREEFSLGQKIGCDRHGRHFHHDAERRTLRREALRLEIGHDFIEKPCRRLELARHRDHRHHDLEIAMNGGARKGAFVAREKRVGEFRCGASGSRHGRQSV